jgi:FAD/FMN-containing dehydrogenase
VRDPADPGRRRALQAGAAAAIGGWVAGCSREAPAPVEVTDAAQFEPMPVARIAQPRSRDELVALVREWRGPLSIGGARYSMGGQIADPGSLHLDMRGMTRLVRLDPAARVVRAEAGMRWRDLLDHLDPHDLSVAIMQSFSNFSLGGSVSVNCHGRYVGRGPLVNSLRALQLVDADGRVRELSREQEPELFAAVVGGYGGLGVVTEVELDLERNEAMRRELAFVPLADYPEWFRRRVQQDPAILMHNADLVPPDFDQPMAVSWRRTTEAPTVAQRLIPRDLDYRREQALIWAASELPGGAWLRHRAQQGALQEAAPVVWRNYEASLDTDALEPTTRAVSTYALQEYFVPVARFPDFARGLARILREHDAGVLNVSIRHSPQDRTSLMRWAASEVFCFVLYYKQRNFASAAPAVEAWSRRLIELALQLGGRWYLPYRLLATPAQFRRAYPEADRFRAIKQATDPRHRFRNALWNKYL